MPEHVESTDPDAFALQPIVTEDILESRLKETFTCNSWELVNMSYQFLT